MARPRTPIDFEAVDRLIERGLSWREIADELDVAPSTLFDRVRPTRATQTQAIAAARLRADLHQHYHQPRRSP